MRFDDQAYIDAYMARGEFPAIHDTMAEMVNQYAKDETRFIDLGSCTGLFPAQLVRKLNKQFVVAVEQNGNYYSRRVKDDRIKWYNIPIAPHSLKILEDIIRGYEIQVVTARRVFPELAEAHGVRFVQDLGVMLKSLNVKIILEGRKPTKNAKALLSSAAIETETLMERSGYECRDLGKNCYLLI